MANTEFISSETLDFSIKSFMILGPRIQTLREKIPLQNFTSQVNLIKGVWNIKVTFVLTLLSVKMQI